MNRLACSSFVAFAVPISRFLYTCIESAEITSPLNFSHKSMASPVFPLAVGPHITTIFFLSSKLFFKLLFCYSYYNRSAVWAVQRDFLTSYVFYKCRNPIYFCFVAAFYGAVTSHRPEKSSPFFHSSLIYFRLKDYRQFHLQDFQDFHL